MQIALEGNLSQRFVSRPHSAQHFQIAPVNFHLNSYKHYKNKTRANTKFTCVLLPNLRYSDDFTLGESSCEVAWAHSWSMPHE